MDSFCRGLESLCEGITWDWRDQNLILTKGMKLSLMVITGSLICSRNKVWRTRRVKINSLWKMRTGGYMFCPLQCETKVQKTGDNVVRVTEREDLYYLTNREVIKETTRKKHTIWSEILMILNKIFLLYGPPIWRSLQIFTNIFQRIFWITSIISILH